MGAGQQGYSNQGAGEQQSGYGGNTGGGGGGSGQQSGYGTGGQQQVKQDPKQRLPHIAIDAQSCRFALSLVGGAVYTLSITPQKLMTSNTPVANRAVAARATTGTRTRARITATRAP